MRGLRERERLPIVTRLAKVSPLGRTVVLKVVTNNRGIVARGIGSVSSRDIGGAIVVRSLVVRSFIVRGVIARRISRLKLRLDSRRLALARIGIVRLSGILGRIFGAIAFGILVGFSLGIFRHGLLGQHLCARKCDDGRAQHNEHARPRKTSHAKDSTDHKISQQDAHDRECHQP